MIDFEYAKDKVMMGPERKSMIMTEEEKSNTAYHEGGHALVAALLPDADPLHKVTIIPRGRALGVTMQLPMEDKYSHTKEYLESTITVMMGGRIAEETFLGHMTTGAGNDIEKATEIARKMVCEWGMSDLGPLTFGKVEGEIFLGRDFGRTQDYSEETANQIDAEVRRIVTAAYKRARKDHPGPQERDAPARPHSAREGSARRRGSPPAHRGGDRHGHREAPQGRARASRRSCLLPAPRKSPEAESGRWFPSPLRSRAPQGRRFTGAGPAIPRAPSGRSGGTSPCGPTTSPAERCLKLRG